MVSTLAGDSLISDTIYKSCIIQLCDRSLSADLIVLQMSDFDVILGMDWLSIHHACLDCHKKVVTFAIPTQPDFYFEGTREHDHCHLIPMIMQIGYLVRGVRVSLLMW